MGQRSYKKATNFIVFADQSFIENSSLLHRLIFLYVSLFLARAKYYGAWLFGKTLIWG